MNSVARIEILMRRQNPAGIHVSIALIVAHLLQGLVEFFIISQRFLLLDGLICRRRDAADIDLRLRTLLVHSIQQFLIPLDKSFGIASIVDGVVHSECKERRLRIGGRRLPEQFFIVVQGASHGTEYLLLRKPLIDT